MDPDASQVQQNAAQTLRLWLREQVPGIRSSNRAPCLTPLGAFFALVAFSTACACEPQDRCLLVLFS